MEGCDPYGCAFGAHRLAKLVRLDRSEPGTVDGQLHHLLLKERHAEGALQRGLHQRMGVGHRLLAVTAAKIRVNGETLDRTGPDQSILDDEVVEPHPPKP